jgi:hypothetical protein
MKVFRRLGGKGTRIRFWAGQLDGGEWLTSRSGRFTRGERASRIHSTGDWVGSRTSLLPPVSDLLQGFMCVCTQVSCSVVSNWHLCDFCGRVYCDILSIFLIPQFCLFLRHQTMDKVQKHNSFNSLDLVGKPRPSSPQPVTLLTRNIAASYLIRSHINLKRNNPCELGLAYIVCLGDSAIPFKLEKRCAMGRWSWTVSR